jgi:hypothetical protein
MKKVVSLIKLEKYFGGAWSLKREEGSETGALSGAAAIFCDLDRKT